MNAGAEIERPPRLQAKLRQLLFWAAIAFLSVPPTIVLHELAHYATAKAFRIPGVVLHYGSVDDEADKVSLPAWQRGMKSAAGPVVTVLLVLASCLAARRFGPHPLAVAPGFAAGVRSVIIGGAAIFWRITQGKLANGGFDQAQAAKYLGLPVELVVGGFTLAVLAGWACLSRLLPASG